MVKFLRVWLLCLLAGGFFVFGCKPKEDGGLPEGQAGEFVEEKPEAIVVIDSACAKIASGDFLGARQIIEGSGIESSSGLVQLGMLIEKYESMEVVRESSRREAFREQMEELDSLREEFADAEVVDVNDIGEILAVAIRAREYGDETQKQAILDDYFVKDIINDALEMSAQYEREGKWLDAYSYCYYWLSRLDEENEEYEKRADELTEKVMIEMSLKDNSCETSRERHEGIRPRMFLKAVEVLHLSYIETVDYGEMTEKALKRCRYLGEVLDGSTEELAYEAKEGELVNWFSGLSSLEHALENEFAVVTKDKFIEKFEEVLGLNIITIGIPEEVVVVQFADASFGALDPFTTLVWPWDVEDFQKNMRQEFPGIGVEISKATGTLTVVSLLPDTPAYNSGLDADDEILAVDGEPTEDMTINCAVSKITGPKGTKVTLTVRHPGSDEVEDITIVRDRIVVPTIRGQRRKEEDQENGQWDHFVDPINKIGYIRVTNFTETTAPNLDEVLTKLEFDGLKGLILDLRSNSGGYLSAAAEVADLFIEEGLIVKSQPRSGWGPVNREMAHKSGTHPYYPVVVLVNRWSASASEIVAGALQDSKYERAIVVGERSYGKGSVQTITTFPGGGSQLKYTMAYYHLPSGQRVKNRYMMEKQGRKDWGIEPDIEIELRSDEMRDMIDVQRANEVLTRADHDEEASPVKRYSLLETVESDPQLAVALLAVKSELVRSGYRVAIEMGEVREESGQSALKD